MIKLGVITDEVSQDLETAIHFARRFGLDGLEIRSVWDRGPFEQTVEDTEKIRELSRAAGLEICCISPPLFKCGMGDRAAYEAHLEGLRRCIDAGHRLGTRLIRGFSFWREPGRQGLEPDYERIAELYKPAVEILRAEDGIIVLEPDPSVNTPNGRTIARLVETIGDSRVGALWDPGNILFDGEGERPYPDGYDAVRELVRHFHLKDAVRIDGVPSVVPVGEGQVDFQGQLQRLLADGYDGYISLETHYRLDRALDEETLRLPAGSGFSNGGLAASIDCMTRFYALLDRWGIQGIGKRRRPAGSPCPAGTD